MVDTTTVANESRVSGMDDLICVRESVLRKAIEEEVRVMETAIQPIPGWVARFAATCVIDQIRKHARRRGSDGP